MRVRPYGYIQLVPPILDAIAEGDIDTIENWRNIGLCSIDPNLWGLRAFKGSKDVSGKSVMKATKGGGVHVETKMDLKNIPLKQWDVVAYHEVIYGDKPWDPPEHHPSSLEILKLPLKVRDVPQVIAYTNYSIKRYNTGINFAYDIWITRDPVSRGCFEGDIELMVWLFSDMGIHPAGEIAAECVLPVLVNGDVYDARWDVWIYPGQQGRWLYVAFTLSKLVKEGVVAVDLSRIIIEMMRVLASIYPDKWGDDVVSNMYVRSIELGTEVFYSPVINVEWYLSEYYLVIPPTYVDSRKALKSVTNLENLLKN